MSRLVDVYPYRMEQNNVKFLVCKRAEGIIYAGQWRMIGGKAKKDEKYYEATHRELKEETGLVPSRFWAIPSLNNFYDPQSDTIQQIPAFGAEINGSKSITLNHEHLDYKWITFNQIDDFINWPEQRRLMKLVADTVMDNEILEEWAIDI